MNPNLPFLLFLSLYVFKKFIHNIKLFDLFEHKYFNLKLIIKCVSRNFLMVGL